MMKKEGNLVKNWVIVFAMVITLVVTTPFSLADKTVYVKPGAADIQQKEAVTLAKTILCESYSDVETILSASEVEASFGYLMAEYSEPIWIVEFYDPNTYDGRYFVMISRRGELLSYQAPFSFPYGPDDDELTNTTFAVPGQHDISEQEAIEVAKRNLFEIGNYEKRMDRLTAKAYFLYGDRYNHGWEPVWLIYFYQDDVLQQKMLLGYDGSYIDTTLADKKLEQSSRRDEGLGVRFGDLNFHMMTLEEKAAFSQKWIPIVEDYIQTHPYYPNQNDLLYQATRHTYGVPGNDDLSQEDAKQIAERAIVTLGANTETISKRSYSYTFDVTNPSAPLWKIFVYGAQLDDISELSKEGNHNRFCVIIDSNTGEIIDAYEYNDFEYDNAFNF